MKAYLPQKQKETAFHPMISDQNQLKYKNEPECVDASNGKRSKLSNQYSIEGARQEPKVAKIDQNQNLELKLSATTLNFYPKKAASTANANSTSTHLNNRKNILRSPT